MVQKYKGLEGQNDIGRTCFLRSLCPSQVMCGDLLFISVSEVKLFIIKVNLSYNFRSTPIDIEFLFSK